MIHPLIQLLATHPELLARHIGAYADLASVEIADVAGLARRKLVLAIGLATSAALGLGLTGMAAMLAAVVPVSQMPYPAVLVGVPALSWAIALVCWWRLHTSQALGAFQALREQVVLDAQMLRQVHQP